MSKKKRSELTNRIEYFWFTLFLNCIRIIPYGWGCWVGKKIGWLAYTVLPSRRRLTIENIKAAQEHGHLSDRDSRQLARQVWENMGLLGSEFLYYYSRGFEALKERVVLEGAANIEKVLAKKKGAILVMAHLGNWELLGLYLSAVGYQLSPLVKNQSNPLVNAIIQERRQSAGMKVISRTGFLRPIILALRKNEMVPFLIDQATRRGVAIEMFGRTANFPPGAAEFALKTDTPVLLTYMVREADRKFRLVVSEEIELTKTGNYEQDLPINATRFIKLLEEVIEAYPDQWLWMHKLWPQTKIKI